MPVNSILVAHTSLDATALNGGHKPELSGDVLDVTLFDVADGEAIVVRKGGHSLRSFCPPDGRSFHASIQQQSPGAVAPGTPWGAAYMPDWAYGKGAKALREY